MKINRFLPTIIFTGVLLIATLVGITHAQDETDWMPDAHLEQAVREALEIPDEIPIHPGDMTGLQNLRLIKIEPEIKSLRGLEHAVNLELLVIDSSEVSDLTPLAGLEKLEFLVVVRSEVSDLTPLAGLENLRDLKLRENRITDITPLAGLANLKVLKLENNQISDVSPLAGLVGLQELSLQDNLLTDISPLQGLMNLKRLHLGGNQIVDFTPIYGLAGIELVLGEMPFDSEVLEILNPADRPVVCDVAGEPILPHIENREYPSFFQACQGIINLPELSRLEGIAYHDLFFCAIEFGVDWFQTPDGWRLIGELENPRSARDQLRAQNPNILLLAGMNYYAEDYEVFPEDSPYWLRDESGNRFKITEWDQSYLDFTHPDVQEMIIQRAIAVAKCGFYDGIHMDHWTSSKIFEGYRTVEEEHAARDRIIQGIRDAVGDDFLILVTTTGTTIPRHAEYINGIFMETIETYEGGYTYAGLFHIESTLLWAEKNLREPQINCLEGRGVRSELLDSPRNLQWMRLWTTLNLTHSDGYLLFTTGSNLDHPSHHFEFWPGHTDLHAQGTRHAHSKQHYWYDFFEAPIGRPIGGDETKGVLYETPKGESINGLFIREFTNGWAVYNRSGKAQEIELPQEVSGWDSGVENQRWHTLADLDGEIYLKAETPPTADINGDGVVNIQDLVIVANALGKAAPDLNSDGIVNIQDLVIVANAF